MNLSIQLCQKQAIVQKFILRQHILRSSLLSMTNEELFNHLKSFEGEGNGRYPMFSVKEFMGVSRHLDVQVKGGIMYESSANYIKYSGAGKKKMIEKNNNRTFNNISWMLQLRESLLKVATQFILKHHHGFFWREEPLKAFSQVEAVKIINSFPEDYFLGSKIVEVQRSSFNRVLKNKKISIDGKEYEMSFFFSTRKVHLSEFGKWLDEITQERGSLPSDKKLSEMAYKEFGISLARRTVTKYRNKLRISCSQPRRVKKNV